MREVTERPEATEAGTVKLVGTNKEKIINSVERVLLNEAEYQKCQKHITRMGMAKQSKEL